MKVSRNVRLLHEFVDYAVLIGMLLGVAGTYWDIRYHIDVGRDSFWIPPHLMVYSGVALVFVSTALAWWLTRKHSHRPLLRRLHFAIGLIWLSVTAQLLTAPIDDLWHRIFGLDVTVWSPPHILLLLGGFCIGLSTVYFQKLYMHLTRADRQKGIGVEELKLEWLFAIGLTGLNIFVAEWEYFRTIPAWHSFHSRPAWFYLVGMTFLFTMVLSLAHKLIQRKWAVVRIAFGYFLLRTAMSIVLFGGSWPVLPMFVFIPALAWIFLTSWRAAVTFAIGLALVQGIVFQFLGIMVYVPTILVMTYCLVAAIVGYSVAFILGKFLLRHLEAT